MSSPSGLALLRRGAGGSAAAAPAQEGGAQRGPWWMLVLPPAVTCAIMLTGVTVPSYWRDEAATLAAVRRPFGDMVAMLGNVDAVHGAYYMLIWVIARLFGTGELALRLPSVIAMTVATTVVRLDTSEVAVVVTVACMPPMSLAMRDCTSPVRVLVKNASDMRCKCE